MNDPALSLATPTRIRARTAAHWHKRRQHGLSDFTYMNAFPIDRMLQLFRHRPPPVPANAQEGRSTGPWLVRLPGLCHIVDDRATLDDLLRSHPQADAFSLARRPYLPA